MTSPEAQIHAHEPLKGAPAAVKSAVRCLSLLETLYVAQEPMRLAEITETLDLPKSSALMLLRTLVSLGYLERDAAGNYSFSSTALGPASWIEGGRHALQAAARPTMQRLSGLIGQTAALCVLTKRLDVQVIDAVQSKAAVRYEIARGTRFPMFCSATGRCFLAFSPPSLASRYFNDAILRKFTEHTVVDRDHLDEIIQATRESGYAINAEEHVLGTISVAAPIFDRTGRIVAALNIGCVAATFHPDGERIISAVCRAAQTITAAIE